MKYGKIVIKVGTSTLAHKNGRLDLMHIEKIVRMVSDICNSGTKVILVSSGAIAAGLPSMHLEKKPDDIPGKQAAAAVGQCRLMNIYEKFFSDYGYGVAQILLSGNILDTGEGLSNVRNTIDRLLDYSIVPIVNENDTVSTDEIQIGDNDTLSAIVTEITGADLLVLFSDIDGFYDRNPFEEGAELIHEVRSITDETAGMAGGAVSGLGTGGMITKIGAARRVNSKGIDMVLLNGKYPERFYDFLEGEFTGTHFISGGKND